MKPYTLSALTFGIILFLPLWWANISGNSAYASSTYYVDVEATSGSNNGSSWANAFTDLQAALEAASTDDEIWVAAGTYLPSKDPFGNTNPTDPRDKTFYLPDGVKMYGGFAGTETAISERNISSNTTILDGDIGTDGDDDGNCYHVALALADPITGIGVSIDGFEIKKGKANRSSTITVAGQAVSGSNGAGILILNGSNMLSLNTIHSNMASGSGGAIYIDNGSSTLSQNTFHSNAANKAGGILINKGSAYFNNNLLFSNTATDIGGAISLELAESTLINNTLFANTATSGTGGLNCFEGTVKLYNSIFWNNTKGGSNNVAGADIVSSSTDFSILYSLTQTNSTYSSGLGMINNQDPLFQDVSDPDGADNIFNTADDGLALSNCSPAIGQGDHIIASALSQDITRAPRLRGGLDLGAYEFQSNAIHYVNKNVAGGLKNGTDWANAFTDLQDALDVVTAGDEIWMASGNYYPSVTNPYTVDELSFYKINGNYESDPTLAHSTTPATPASTYDADGYWEYIDLGITADEFTWVNGISYGHPFAEIQVASFSGGGGAAGGNNGSALPVELIKFKGKNEGSENHLFWSTETELNNQGFEIERSADGQKFQLIGYVSGQGTTAEISDYKFIDEVPFRGDNYYRLKQVDFDGAFEYSPVIHINTENTKLGLGELYPNPIGRNTVYVDYFTKVETDIQINIYELSGQLIRQEFFNSSIGNHQVRLDCSDLPKGAYLIYFEWEGQRVQRKLIIQ